MNQRKPLPCSMLPLKRPPLPHAASLPFYAGSSWAPEPLPSIAPIGCDGSRLTWPATAPAKDASQMGNGRSGGSDTTRRRVIMRAMTTYGLPSLPASRTLAGMMPFAPVLPCSSPFKGRSLLSLAAVAGRVADGLRREPCGLMLARPLPCPSLPAAAGARGGFGSAVLIAPCAAPFSTVVSLL